jgi:hypothetical protein
MKGKLIKTDVNYILEDDKGVVIASTSLKRVEGLSLSLKNCQAIEGGYNLDELVKREYLDGYDTTELCRTAFKDGFQKALELMGDDVFNWLEKKGYLSDDKDILKEEYNHQTEWDVEIEMICPHPEATYVCGIQYGCDEDGCNHPNKIPLLDTGGCLILKKI